MSTPTLSTIAGGLPLAMLTIPAAELAEGDVIAGETWRKVELVLVYQGEHGPEVQVVTTPASGGAPSEPYHVAADRRFAVLRAAGTDGAL